MTKGAPETTLRSWGGSNRVVWSDEKVSTVRRMFLAGVALYHIGRAVGFSETVVSKKVRELGLTRKRGIYVGR